MKVTTLPYVCPKKFKRRSIAQRNAYQRKAKEILEGEKDALLNDPSKPDHDKEHVELCDKQEFISGNGHINFNDEAGRKTAYSNRKR